jgi:hypothetical protein
MISEILEAMMGDILKIFENEFVKHEPEMQALLIHYAKSMSLRLDVWAKSKIEHKS